MLSIANLILSINVRVKLTEKLTEAVHFCVPYVTYQLSDS